MEPKQPTRLYSLDALRGFDMLFIMGAGAFFTTLATVLPNPVTEFLAEQQHHVDWHGFRFEDMIFPLFLFIAGVSFPYSIANKKEKGLGIGVINKEILRRGLTLVLFGILYNNGFNFDFPEMRYASVLGRIGLAWMFAAYIYVGFKQSVRLIWIAALLIGYWLVMSFIPAPDAPFGAGIFSPEGNFAGWIDRLFLYGKWAGETQDPEGFFSTIPAIGTALMGMQAGRFIRWEKEGLTPTKKVLYMLIAGLILMIIGQLWDLIFPINKKLWTSSFVCYVGGISTLLLALFYFIIDVKGYRSWAFFFKVIGVNSITIYMAQKVIGFHRAAEFFGKGTVGLFSEEWGAVIASLFYIGVCWTFLYFLYKQKIFLKV